MQQNANETKDTDDNPSSNNMDVHANSSSSSSSADVVLVTLSEELGSLLLPPDVEWMSLDKVVFIPYIIIYIDVNDISHSKVYLCSYKDKSVSHLKICIFCAAECSFKVFI